MNMCPFQAHVPEQALTDRKERIQRTMGPDEADVLPRWKTGIIGKRHTLFLQIHNPERT
jgi:hypothetical protein